MASKIDDDVVIIENGKVVRRKQSSMSQPTQPTQQQSSNDSIVTIRDGKVVREPQSSLNQPTKQTTPTTTPQTITAKDIITNKVTPFKKQESGAHHCGVPR